MATHEPETRSQERLRALVRAGIALSSELSLESVLQKLVEASAELTGARYAALGVIDRSGQRLERFLTHGVDPELRELIGELPHGRGILGVLIREAQPLRLHELADDPRSVGFPPGHPEMHTFLGVPILLRGVAYGNLYLTEKEGGGDFTEEDEDLLRLLAAQAAVAIENARLYESATRWLRQLESLTEVGNALAEEIDLPRLLTLVCVRLRELLEARLVLIVLPEGDQLRVHAADGEGADEIVGATFPIHESKAGRVLERRRPERVDSVLDDPEVNVETVRRLAARSGLFVPLLHHEQAIGVIAAFDKQAGDPRFTADDLRLAETLASRAATAVHLSQRVSRDAVRRVVEAQELERKRLARELHDETGQALTSILLGLRSLEEADPQRVREATAEMRELVVSTLQDVRRLAIELRPKALDDFGLVPALERLIETFRGQTGITVELESRLRGVRLPPEAETAVYRIVQEALTNVVKHARARNVSVLLTNKDTSVVAVVEDDGEGFQADEVVETTTGGLGLVGMRERIALVGGRLAIESSRGAGTTLVVEVPVR
ncbi:MAG TPA: GAF domain-containing sensor histidine kinase [Gaiellaceae bacterium]|nr:GAF domain-containing sensor histidine kinase [Gaiellaceae bacterium]